MIAKIYLDTKDWDSVKQYVIDNNTMQKSTHKTGIRIFSEIKKRLKNLTDEELEYFKDASIEEAKVLSFIGCLKTYRLIYEFALEVIREKFLLFDYNIEPSDYISFYESKEVSSKKLSTISEMTQYKLRQVMYLMFAEVSLIESTKNLYITKPLLSEALIAVLLKDSPKLLSIFLMNNDEIAFYKQRSVNET